MPSAVCRVGEENKSNIPASIQCRKVCNVFFFCSCLLQTMPSHWPTTALNASHSLLLAKTKEKLSEMPKHLKSKDNHTKYACSRALCVSVSVSVYVVGSCQSLIIGIMMSIQSDYPTFSLPESPLYYVPYHPNLISACGTGVSAQRIHIVTMSRREEKNRKYLTMEWCVSASYICKYTHTKCHCFVDHIWRWRFVRWG